MTAAHRHGRVHAGFEYSHAHTARACEVTGYQRFGVWNVLDLAEVHTMRQPSLRR